MIPHSAFKYWPVVVLIFSMGLLSSAGAVIAYQTIPPCNHQIPANFKCILSKIEMGKCPEPVPYDGDGDGVDDSFICGTRVVKNDLALQCTGLGAQPADHCMTLNSMVECGATALCIWDEASNACEPLFGSSATPIGRYEVNPLPVACYLGPSPDPVGGGN